MAEKKREHNRIKLLIRECNTLLQQQTAEEQQQSEKLHENNPIISPISMYEQEEKQQETLLHHLKQLQPVTEELNSLQTKGMKNTLDTRTIEERLKGLAEWLLKEAPDCMYGERFLFTSGLEEGIGVIANQHLEKGQHYMSIPRSVMLTTETASADSHLSVLMKDPLCMKMPSMLLAIHLLDERSKGTKSFWYPYISCLPSHHTLPFLLPTQRIKDLLQSSPAINEILSLKRSLIRQYFHLYNVLKMAGLLHQIDFAFSSYQWAVCTVMTRQNKIPSRNNPNQSIIALIPGWDFCNHRGYGSICTYYDPLRHVSESFTMEEVDKGQPIYLFYGSRPNTQLAIYSGFVDNGHQHDTIQLTLTYIQDDPIYKMKTLLLSKVGLTPTYRLTLPLPSPPSLSRSNSSNGSTNERKESPPSEAEDSSKTSSTSSFDELFHWLRVMCATKSQLSTALLLKSEGKYLPKINEENELQAYALLIDLLTKKYDKYGTTIQHDDGILQDTSSHLTPTEKVCIQLRRAEMKLITQAIQQVQQWKENIA